MKTITIPTWRNPYIVILNGAKYVYMAGEEIEVPDGVAAIIEADIKAHEAAQAPEIVPPASYVKTVNGTAPDENGNVQVETGSADIVVHRINYCTDYIGDTAVIVIPDDQYASIESGMRQDKVVVATGIANDLYRYSCFIAEEYNEYSGENGPVLSNMYLISQTMFDIYSDTGDEGDEGETLVVRLELDGATLTSYTPREELIHYGYCEYVGDEGNYTGYRLETLDGGEIDGSLEFEEAGSIVVIVIADTGVYKSDDGSLVFAD